MCSFNAINGVPGCANKYTETKMLKHQWGFDGFIESDYTAVAETRACPPVNPPTPARAGTASRRTVPTPRARPSTRAPTPRWCRTNYRDFGAQLVASGQVTMSRIDDAVRRILRVKFRAGLFDHPYVDPAKAAGKQLLPASRAAARRAAGRSMVLLKNDGNILPLDPSKSTAVIGPLGDDKHDMLGPWWGQGRDEDAVSVFDGDQGAEPEHDLHARLHAQPQRPRRPARTSAPRTRGFQAAVDAANAADQVVLAARRDARDERRGRVAIPPRPARPPGGPDRRHQGDGQAVRGRAVQRPPARPDGRVDASSPAILEAWFPGVEAGNAVADVAVRQGQPGRQAAGQLPALRRPGADLLQPRAHRPPVRHRRASTTRATATSTTAARCTSSATA